MLVSGSAGGAWAKTCHVGDDAQFFSGSDSTKQGASPYRTEDYGKSRLWAGMSEHQKQWKIAHIIGRNSSGVNSGWWGIGRRCWLPTIPRGEYHFKQREFRTMDTKWHKWGTSLPPSTPSLVRPKCMMQMAKATIFTIVTLTSKEEYAGSTAKMWMSNTALTGSHWH